MSDGIRSSGASDREDTATTADSKAGRAPLPDDGASELRRARRALQVLSAMHDALDDATDEDDLCDRVCRVAVHVGGYVGAWVGRAEHDERCAVVPVAACAVDMAWLRGLGLRWSDTEGGRGPVGVAIRTGEPVSVRASLDDPRTRHVAAEAARNQWLSGIGLPLRARGRTLGVFVLYARDEGSFDEQETALLVELGRGLSRAWRALLAEAERQRVESRLHEIAEASRDLFWSRDARTGAIDYVSSGATRIWGEAPAGGPGSPESFLATVHPDDRPTLRDVIARQDAGEATEILYRILRRDGEIRWLHARAFPVRDAAGAQLRVVGVTTDVTEHHRVQEALQELAAGLERRVAERTAELEGAARAKDDFLAQMSHELRTPLNAVLGHAELLLEEVYGPLVADQRASVRRIEESGRHLLSLIDDVLDVAKIEAGKLQIALVPVAAGDVCRDALAFVEEAAARKGISLVRRELQGVPKVLADARRLKQILVNLLSNAVKFTPAGGQVGLSTSWDEASGAVRFLVWDTGIGIAPSDQQRLFRRFEQIHSDPSQTRGGTGLGLALVRELVALHGGRVGVESERGKGSRFTVDLPGLPDVPASGPVAPPESRHLRATLAPSPGRILLADDDAANVDVVRDYLEAGGYVVEVASNGQQAVEAVRARPPDLVLMDIQMPVKDGLTAIAELRADPDPALRGIPIVAVSAFAMAKDRERGLAAGATAYLTKPVGLRATRDLVAELIAARRG